MSSCLVLQMKESIIIGGDSAASQRLPDGSLTRTGNNLKKLYHFGREIMFVGGLVLIKDYIVKNIKMDGDRIDKKHLQKFLKDLNYTESWNDNPIGVLIAGVDDNGESYLYNFSAISNYELDIRTNPTDGIQVWVGGFKTKECLKAANTAIANSEFVEDVYKKTYKDIACDPVGGNINVYQITSSGINQLLSNYDLQDGITPKTDKVYGIWADVLCGDIIAGKQVTITDKNNSVVIDEKGIALDGGAIRWINKLPSTAVEGYDVFKENVRKMLGATTITADSVISPKIGGGYLYIKDSRTTDNTGIGVEINPSGTSFNGHDSDYVFNISKDGKTIMGVDNNGNGEFAGKVKTASGSKIGGFEIGDNTIHSQLGGDSLEISSGYNGITLSHIDDDGNTQSISIKDYNILLRNENLNKVMQLSTEGLLLSNGSEVVDIAPDRTLGIFHAITLQPSSNLTLSTTATKFSGYHLVDGSDYSNYFDYSSSSGDITIKKAGTYLVSAQVYFTDGFTVNDIAHVFLYKNNTAITETQDRFYIANPYACVSLSPYAISCSAGDKLSIRCYNQNGARGSIGYNKTHVTIMKL